MLYKDNSKRIRIWATDWEKNLQNTHLIKKYLKLFKELLKLRNKKTV